MTRSTVLVCALLGACAPAGYVRPAPTAPSPASEQTGVLVMAHGGSHEWNETVHQAVLPLSAELPTSIAFGMAEPTTLVAALESLDALGVRNVAVVRMFVSGQSFLDQTNYLLGLSEAPPERFILHDHVAHGGADPLPIEHGLTIATHSDGLMDSPQARRIIAERAHGQSSDAQQESVLILAHGMGDDAENDRLLRAMESMTARVSAKPFASVRTAALREDWQEKRAAAEEEIRAFVRQESSTGRRVIVVPLRLSGFGPYANVLVDLEYTPTAGLLPHPAISEWLRVTAAGVICAQSWHNPLGDCGASVAQPTERR